jgi:hypothetical protein
VYRKDHKIYGDYDYYDNYKDLHLEAYAAKHRPATDYTEDSLTKFNEIIANYNSSC